MGMHVVRWGSFLRSRRDHSEIMNIQLYKKVTNILNRKRYKHKYCTLMPVKVFQKILTVSFDITCVSFVFLFDVFESGLAHDLSGVLDAYPHNVNLLAYFVPLSPVVGGIEDGV